MSILIKGIDMPNTCEECEVWSLCHYPKVPKGIKRREPDCPLIEIPTPHGGLIDRSVLFEEYQNLCNGLLCRDCPFFKENSCSIEEWILNQPPILEAEEE